MPWLRVDASIPARQRTTAQIKPSYNVKISIGKPISVTVKARKTWPQAKVRPEIKIERSGVRSLSAHPCRYPRKISSS